MKTGGQDSVVDIAIRYRLDSPGSKIIHAIKTRP